MLIAVLACGWLLGAPPGVSARKCKDEAACRDCLDRTLSEVEDCSDADTLITNRQDRTTTFNVQYGICAELAPGRPGSCTLTIRALNKCARTRVRAVNRSWTTFKKNARRMCGREAMAAANKARRQCLRDAACFCAAPTTTSTTTTSTSTTTSSTSTTTSTTAGSTTSTTTTSVTTTSGTASTATTTTSTTFSSTTTTTGGGPPPPPTPDGSECQLACINRVVAGCYSDCVSSCGPSTGALPKCERACRNGQCADLRKLCVPSENTDFESNNPQGLNQNYFACCKVNETCDDDTEESLSCETTTTVTTTTSTSSTTSTTGTGLTTTTITITTTTLFPAIPTTTLVNL